MRLNCPNCGAQYEVPADVIPTEGRDVQCSSCGITWFQAHPDHAAAPDLELDIPAPEEEWVPTSDAQAEALEDEAPTSEVTEEPAEVEDTTAFEDAIKAAVQQSIPEEVDQVITEEVEARIEDSPLGDFEAELDAALSEGREVSWDDAAEPEADPIAEPEQTAEAEDAPFLEPETPAIVEPEEEAASEPEPEDQSFEAEEIAPVVAAPIAERGRARRRREVDPAVADVLREEAAHEAQVRQAEDPSMETQTELGFSPAEEDVTAERASKARRRMARLRADTEAPEEAETSESRRNLLPDIEEINSTLRATEDRAPDELPDGRKSASHRQRGARRIGFALGMLLIAGLMFIYASPQTLIQQMPESEGIVKGYVAVVDNGRIWLDVQMTKLMLWLDGLASESTETSGS